MTDTNTESRTFGGWQQEKVAFIFGLSGRRAALAGAAVLALILPITTGHMPDAIVSWPVALVLAAIAFTRFGGRTVDEWAVSAISSALVRARGQHRFAGGPFVPPSDLEEGGLNATQKQDLNLPGILDPLRVLSAPAARGRDLAIVQHPLDGTWTAVARIVCPGIGLADSGRQYQRVAGWGALLAGLCTDSPVIRVQALQRLVPESGAALRSWHEAHVMDKRSVPELAHDVTMELLHQSTLVTNRREAYLAFTMDARRVRGQIRAAGGGETGTARVMIRYLQGLAHAMACADLQIEDWLSARDLAEVLRTAFDPHSQPVLADRRAEARSRPGTAAEAGTNLRNAGPVYAETRPGSYAHDGAVSVTYWVQEWPSEAWCTGLGPLLSDSGSRRSLSLVYEPLAPRVAERAVMRERTARHVAVRMRQRTGQIIPEHERVASMRAQRQDAERAAGHGLVRFAGYVTVTVNDEQELADACAALEADAAQARVEIRRMWFAQDSGFAMGALPLGFGLPARRW
jgi:hypothetical protein